MNRFIFKSYDFEKNTFVANFHYAFESGREFTEKVEFKSAGDYDEKLLGRALFLAFILIGTSYYKTFPSREVVVDCPIDKWQANFFNHVYQEGLGQFAFENDLTRDDLAHFIENSQVEAEPISYQKTGILALQSGGKDSLLTASLLKKQNLDFTAWYLSNGEFHPEVIDKLGVDVLVSKRILDRSALESAARDGALNGHVPITYIVQSLALIQAILLGKNEILVSIAHEGEEPHHQIGDLMVTHQWSKTWQAELDFAEYVHRYVSADIKIGSPLRKYSELRVAELFVESAWSEFGSEFSSCNTLNYSQGADNRNLMWCSECPKCANSYLLFAPFLPSDDLKPIFGGVDLFTKPELVHTFMGLLGVNDVSKPFECIGEIDELRLAYHMAIAKGDYAKLPFNVPESNFDYKQEYPSQLL